MHNVSHELSRTVLGSEIQTAGAVVVVVQCNGDTTHCSIIISIPSFQWHNLVNMQSRAELEIML